jgi:predicted ATP-grasp superfamily ATP-dependent carboligase
VIPGDDSTLAALSQAAHRFAGRTQLACPPFELVRQVLDKEATMGLAARSGIPTPRTVRLDRGRALAPQLEGLRFPLVLKPAAKFLDGQGDRFKVLYCRSTSEVARCLADLSREEPGPLAQEYIVGRWVCVAVLMGKGRPLAHFQYRHLRALPPGGVGVRRVAEPVHPDLVGYLVRFLQALGWEGVAQAEFLVEDGVRPYLMDVNGRFWASIGLTLAAGMDFPVWLYRYLVEGAMPPQVAYRGGVGCRWLVGELQRLEHFLRGGAGNDLRDSPSKVRALGDFLASSFSTGSYDEFLWGDLRPGLRALWRWGVGRWWWWPSPSDVEATGPVPGIPAEAGGEASPAA